MSASQQPTRPYFHNGQALSAPPATVRIRNFFDNAYVFLGLYVTTFFSFDPAAAAAASPFNANNRTPGKRPGWGFGGGSSNSRGGGPPPPGGRKVGRVDDVRGPECKSCK
ncbi:hypothetical protein D6C84_03120 [Aureobasidium pullulans]|uniref:Uncharacterized protein n=2 Tax=Aureobasidium pullulans TaxID=5580 RepID=A0A074XUH8_AURPU|nr:uncharacterized protein M438DRAFT_340956 [Aureobasidium pullulans EXF-150]KEQ89135.1 hypothetical protein M438DRAFT_340956 [Aureobasidium pullulans EXF-150]OBW64345.1 MAG: Uncharacterized protein AUREO_055890 [Aureobasidium pullulans]THV93053.1 hypothetical protein D6D27_04572 [Aureobasidium pullulans]THZ85704.1 hypothetical protein D6C84_03120 [Aureobasidium pullulans]